MKSFFDPSLFLQLSSEQHKIVVYNHTFDILQDAPRNLALVLKVWTLWQILAFFKKKISLSSKCSQAIWTEMTVEKVYLKHIISQLNEFAVLRN